MRFQYDLAIAPRWGSIMISDAIYFAYLTGASERIGYSSSVDGGDPAMDRLLTRAASGGWHEHETARNLNLLVRAGITGMGAPLESAVDRPIQSIVNLVHRGSSRREPCRRFPWFSAAPARYAVVSPGATKPFNIWPIARLAEVARVLHDLNGMPCVVVGSVGDAALCGELAQLAPDCAISIAGRTDLQEVTQLLSEAALFIGMDSGIAHIAGALGIPTVVLSPFPTGYGDEHPGSPVRFRPCGPRVKVLQPREALPPCCPTCACPGSHCICQIEVSEVVDAAVELVR